MTEKKPSPCLDEMQLTKALSLGLKAAEAAHLQGCEQCRGQWQALERTRVLLKELPCAELPADRRLAVRDALLVKAPALGERRRPGRIWLVAATGLAAGLALLVVARGWFAGAPTEKPGAEIPVVRGTVVAQGPAVFARSSSQPDELVRVSEGTLHLKVHHLNQGERFRVVTSDAEVEVRGTAFEVRAHGNRLFSVRVSEGLVEVRPTGKPIMLLGPGDEWNRQEVAEQPPTAASASQPSTTAPALQPPSTAPVTTSRPTASTSPRPRIAYAAPKTTAAREPAARVEPQAAPPPVEKTAPEAKPAPKPADAVERQFQLGWSALRSHNPGEAARAFAIAASQAGEQPLAEDASFWHAVALERAAHDEDARTALAVFIARYPHSPRAGEASALLGWLLLDKGDKPGAMVRFRAALFDPVERVRASASAGLQAIERR